MLLLAIAKIAWTLREEVLDEIDELDQNLAKALQGTIAQVAENIEPPNPIHGMIAQWLSMQTESSQIPAVEILKDSSGRFQSKD